MTRCPPADARAAETPRTHAILLPGMLGSARLWASIVSRFPVTIDAIAIDYGSEADSIEAVAVQTIEQSPSRFAIVGHSLGGILALEIVKQAPERVTGLVLLGSSPRGPSEEQIRDWARLRRQVLQGMFEQIVAAQPDQLLPPHRSSEAALRRQIVAMSKDVGVNSFMNQLTVQMGRNDYRPSLHSISVPTLVLSGSDDQVCPPDRQQELVDGIPGSRLETFARCGHMIPIERPTFVADLLKQFLLDLQ